MSLNTNVTYKEIQSRKEDIEEQLLTLFKANMKITDWDVPEADDQVAAELICEILQAKLDSIKNDVQKGEYKNY